MALLVVPAVAVIMLLFLRSLKSNLFLCRLWLVSLPPMSILWEMSQSSGVMVQAPVNEMGLDTLVARPFPLLLAMAMEKSPVELPAMLGPELSLETAQLNAPSTLLLSTVPVKATGLKEMPLFWPAMAALLGRGVFLALVETANEKLLLPRVGVLRLLAVMTVPAVPMEMMVLPALHLPMKERLFLGVPMSVMSLLVLPMAMLILMCLVFWAMVPMFVGSVEALLVMLQRQAFAPVNVTLLKRNELLVPPEMAALVGSGALAMELLVVETAKSNLLVVRVWLPSAPRLVRLVVLLTAMGVGVVRVTRGLLQGVAPVVETMLLRLARPETAPHLMQAVELLPAGQARLEFPVVMLV